jgi:hypothetical protein
VEAEIIARGHETLHLRVVQSNAAAIEFYLRHGWRIARAFPHEKFSIAMLEMLESNRSLIEDRRLQVTDSKDGERGRNRTYNLLIKSQLLCQLSYAPAVRSMAR